MHFLPNLLFHLTRISCLTILVPVFLTCIILRYIFIFVHSWLILFVPLYLPKPFIFLRTLLVKVLLCDSFWYARVPSFSMNSQHLNFSPAVSLKVSLLPPPSALLPPLPSPLFSYEELFFPTCH